jgi:hypothetical protein
MLARNAFSGDLGNTQRPSRPESHAAAHRPTETDSTPANFVRNVNLVGELRDVTRAYNPLKKQSLRGDWPLSDLKASIELHSTLCRYPRDIYPCM